MEYRCGWCLDWILIDAKEKKPENCPYCGADMSTKSPKYDEMMVRIKSDLNVRQHDSFLERLRRFQYHRKTSAITSDVEPWSPLAMKRAGYTVTWGSPLLKLIPVLEYLYTNSNAPDVEQKKRLVYRIGMQVYHAGNVKSGFSDMQDVFFAAVDALVFRYGRNLDKYRSLWNGICDEWKY